MTTCGGQYGCDYCVCKGKRQFQKQTYPFSSSHGLPRRTTESCREIADHLHDLDLDGKVGIQQKSPLLDLPNFDFVRDVVIGKLNY